MNDKNAHVAYFIKDGNEIYTAYSKIQIAEKILEIIKN